MSSQNTELARDLGFLEAYTLGLGTMIGAGIFVLPGIVAEAAGPASMISFVIGGIVALLAAFSLSELATGMPKAGGSYYYVNHALGSLFGTIVGWGMWGGLMFATAFYMLGFGQYLLDRPATALTVVAAGMLMAALLVLLNYRGVKETGSFQNIVVIALVALIFLFIAVGLPQVDQDLLQPFTAGQGWGAVGATAGTVFVTFIGFEVIATSAEEVKDPGRNLPLAMIAAVLTPTVLYVLVMLVSTGILEVPVLADSDVPVADVARDAMAVFGTLTIGGMTFELPRVGEIVIGRVALEFSAIGGIVMIVGAILATISSANASIMSAARVNFAMGRDRILSEWLNQIHSSYRTPYRAILATGAVILLLIAGPFPIDFLADVAAFMFLITYALVHVAVIVLRRAGPENYNPDFLIPTILYPTVPILGIGACIAVMYQMPLTVQLTGFGIVGVGLIWYQAYSKEQAIAETYLGDAVMPMGDDTDSAAGYRVVVPVANPETQQTLIRYAAASVAARDGPGELVVMNVIEVPPQTSPAQVEQERVTRQQELLDESRAVADELDVPVRTRELVGRSAANAVLSVIEDERADQVLLGWQGPRRRRDVLFGTTIDPILEDAPCEVTLVKDPTESPGDIVSLVGRGPNAIAAVKRGVELHNAFEDTSLTLLTVQPPLEDDEGAARTEGLSLTDSLLSSVEYDTESVDTRVSVSEGVRATIIDELQRYDTVTVGATGQTKVAETLFGSIPREIVERASGTVLMARAQREQRRSLREAVGYRLLDTTRESD